MSKVFRAKYVDLLRKSELKIPQSTYDKVFSKNWVVYAKRPFLKPEFVIEYLGRYSHPIRQLYFGLFNVDYCLLY